MTADRVYRLARPRAEAMARARELLSSLDAPAAAREEAALEARRAEASLRIARGE